MLHTKSIIKVDTRERNKTGDPKETYHIVLEYAPNAIEELLPVGDIAYNNIIIELKNILDFISTITEPRFRNQLYNLVKENPELKVFYNIYFDDKVKTWPDINIYSQIRPEAVFGAICSIQARYGVYCFIFPSKKHAIWASVNEIIKSTDNKPILPQTYQLTNTDKAINVLRSGAGRLKESGVINALEEYGTAYKVIQAIVNNPKLFVKQVKNWGIKTAEEFVHVITHNFNDPKLINGNDLEGKKEETIKDAEIMPLELPDIIEADNDDGDVEICMECECETCMCDLIKNIEET